MYSEVQGLYREVAQQKDRKWHFLESPLFTTLGDASLIEMPWLMSLAGGQW